MLFRSTHFSREESVETGRGKLKEELVRMAPLIHNLEKEQFVILNELFTTVTTYDACKMGKEIMQRFVDANCKGVYVTHLPELSECADYVVSMTALTDEKNSKIRTYKIVRKKANGYGFANDIVAKHRYKLLHFSNFILLFFKRLYRT